MKSCLLVVFITLFLAAAIAHTAFAQQAQAEPNRVEFKRGATSTTISGVVHGDEQAEYVLSAKKGQRLIIKLSDTPTKSSCFDLDNSLDLTKCQSFIGVQQTSDSIVLTAQQKSSSQGSK